MHGIPNQVELSGLIGQAVHSVCAWNYGCNIVFENAVIGELTGGITIEQNGSNVRYDGTPGTAYVLHGLLGRTVSAIVLKPNDGIRVEFDDGKTLILADHSDQFESFTIDIDGKTVLVV